MLCDKIKIFEYTAAERSVIFMKWMIASDIHGSAYYCEKMIEAYRTERADRLLLLGDLLYHGPRNDLPRDYAPKKVIAMLNKMKNEHCLRTKREMCCCMGIRIYRPVRKQAVCCI